MHECFTITYSGLERSGTYISNTDGYAAIAKNALDIFRTIAKEQNKAYFIDTLGL